MNRADDSIALSNAITHLLSGKATNLEAFHLAIKGFAVKCVQQRGHQIECKLNGKSSVKQNPYFARIAKEAPTHELEAKAKAKAERDEVEGASAEQVALTTEIVKVGRKLDTALGGDKRLKRVKTTIGNLRAKLSRLEEQLAKTKQSRQTV
tara:strand:- start:340 stop:792 length:453 start_codon:yes stop_codon:yes gene_type:complete